jgi:hypothetical protein
MKKNRLARQAGALARLKEAKFFEKNYRKSGQARNQETWEEKRQQEIETLEKRVNA